MPRRRFDCPRDLLRACAAHDTTVAGLDKLKAEALAERAALLGELAELLRHFPHGLVFGGLLYRRTKKGRVKVRPAPTDAAGLDGWPGEAVAGAVADDAGFFDTKPLVDL